MKKNLENYRNFELVVIDSNIILNDSGGGRSMMNASSYICLTCETYFEYCSNDVRFGNDISAISCPNTLAMKA